MKQKKISVAKTARYFVIGEDSQAIQNVWFICHGYGHLASYFLKHFNILDNGENLLVAPEGLHRFYLKGASGRVGASWMTKEDRLDDIKDYISYLDEVFREVTSGLNPKVKINILGFSQGAATASRWVEAGCVEANNLILWAGVFPGDVKFPDQFGEKTKVLFILGDKDEYLSSDLIKTEIEKLNDKKGSVEFIQFKGGHEIDKDTLMILSEKLK